MTHFDRYVSVGASVCFALSMGCGISERTVSELANGGSGGSSGASSNGGNTFTIDGNAGASSSTGGNSGSGGNVSAGAGAGGAPDTIPTSTIGSVGDPCSPQGAYGCAGNNQRYQLRCDGGVWQSFGQCPSDERCDTSESNAGLCEPVLPQCVGKQPGDTVCDGECGPDLLTIEDAENCDGVCVNEVCEKPVTIASNQVNVIRLAIDSQNVYWTDYDPIAQTGGNIVQVSKSGGTPLTLASSQPFPYGMAVDATSVYWTNHYGGIEKIAVGGGTKTSVSSASAPQNGIAVDETSVYWANQSQAIVKAPIEGGSPTAIAAADDPYDVVIDESNVYWTNPGVGDVKKVGKSGGTVSDVATGLSNPLFLVVDATNIYVAEAVDQGTVKKIPLAGGSPVDLATGCKTPLAVAVDETSVYWTNSGEGTVMMVPIAGGQPLTLASGESSLGSIVVDSTSLYWSAGTQVRKLKVK